MAALIKSKKGDREQLKHLMSGKRFFGVLKIVICTKFAGVFTKEVFRF